MMSQAGTGFSFNTKRSRLREKLTLLHYDPVGKIQRSYSMMNSMLSSPVALSRLMLNVFGSWWPCCHYNIHSKYVLKVTLAGAGICEDTR